MIPDVHVCCFIDSPDVTLRYHGETWRFEWSDRFGPLMLGKRGSPLSTTPPRCSPFWRALQWWIAQGKRVEQGVGLFQERVKTASSVRMGPRTRLFVRPDDVAAYPAEDIETVSIDDYSASGVEKN